MRFDKLTTRFQQAFADAQSLALGADNGYIEPQHLLLALLQQQDGGSGPLLARAGVQVAALKNDLTQALARLPKVEGQGGEISVSRDLNNLLNLTEKGRKLEMELTTEQRARLAAAYKTAGAEAVEGFRKVMLGIMDAVARGRFAPGS